jgi:hypothetical protein
MVRTKLARAKKTATVACFAISFLLAQGLTANAVPPSSTVASPPPIDLSNPTATVNDPAANLVPVDTSCTGGKVDLNTASANDLATSLGIHSGPTVERLIQLRPWLKGADLSSVPGIGPPLAARIAPKTCATQPAPPANQPLACTSSAQVDLNTASAATIHSTLGLPAVAVNALIAARPLSQNLSQYVAPRVPGFTRPAVDSWMSAGTVCVTPAPFIGGSALYRWITASGGAVIRQSGFALIVPPGRVKDPAGAYGAVTPMAPEDGVLPQADYHIYGRWNTGTTSVAVQGPYIAPGAPGRPVVFHDAEDGMRMSIGDGTALSTVDGTPTVTTSWTSLSAGFYGYSACQPLPGITFGSPACIKALTDGSIKQAWLDDAVGTGKSTQKSLIEQTHCGDVGTGHVVSGSLPFGESCDQTFNASTGDVTWSMTNKGYLNIALGLASGEVVYNYSLQGDQYTDPPKVDGGAESNFILDLLSTYAAPHLRWLFAGQVLHVNKQQGFLNTTVNVNSNPLATGLWNGVSQFMSTFGSVTVKSPFAAAFNDLRDSSALTGCITNPSDSSLGCVEGILEAVADELKKPANAAKYGLGSADTAFYASTSTIFKWLGVVEWAASFGASVVFQHIGGTGVVLSNEPIAPTMSNGRAVDPACLSHNDTRWVVDETCQDIAYGNYTSVGSGAPPPACDANSPLQDAFSDWDGLVTSCRLYNVLLRDSNGVLNLVRLENGKLIAHPISRGDEESFKEDWPEWEWRADQFASSVDAIGSPAVNDPLLLRDFTHGRGGNWLLRESNGYAWYIDGQGIRHGLGHDATRQQAVAARVLTLDPAQWAGDICPYPAEGSTGLNVC